MILILLQVLPQHSTAIAHYHCIFSICDMAGPESLSSDRTKISWLTGLGRSRGALECRWCTGLRAQLSCKIGVLTTIQAADA